jgi:hypothetical protein
VSDKRWFEKDGERYFATVKDGCLRGLHQRVYVKLPVSAGGGHWMNKLIWHPGGYAGKLSKRARGILPADLAELPISK